jgi:hypothetical protein
MAAGAADAAEGRSTQNSCGGAVGAADCTKISDTSTAKDSHAKDSHSPSASISTANGKASTSPKKVSMSAKEAKQLRGSHEPQRDDSDDKDLRTTRSKEEDNEWYTDGNEYIGKRVRCCVFDSTGKLTVAADGIIVGWLSKEKSNFFAANTPPERDRPHPPCKPAALWRLKYDDAALGGENLEEHEVIEAIDLMSTELPACIAEEEAKPTKQPNRNDSRAATELQQLIEEAKPTQQPKPTCSCQSNHKNSAAKDNERTSVTLALSSNRYKANLLVYEPLSY